MEMFFLIVLGFVFLDLVVQVYDICFFFVCLFRIVQRLGE